MKNRAEFDIIGRVGNIRTFDNATRVSICANYRKKDANDKWSDDPHWNEVVVFGKRRRDYINEEIKKGDLVVVRGRMRQNSFKDRESGEDRFTTDLVAHEVGLLAKKQVETDDE